MCGCGSIGPWILKLDIRWREVVRFTPQLFYTREKRRRYPLKNTRVGKPQGQHRRVGLEKNIFFLTENVPRYLVCPAYWRATTVITLFRPLPCWLLRQSNGKWPVYIFSAFFQVSFVSHKHQRFIASISSKNTFLIKEAVKVAFAVAVPGL